MAYGMMRKTMKKMAKSTSVNKSSTMMNKLKEHAKLHKGGMASKHIKKMKIYLKEGFSFNQAHTKTIAFLKKKKCNKSIAKCDC